MRFGPGTCRPRTTSFAHAAQNVNRVIGNRCCPWPSQLYARLRPRSSWRARGYQSPCETLELPAEASADGIDSSSPWVLRRSVCQTNARNCELTSGRKDAALPRDPSHHLKSLRTGALFLGNGRTYPGKRRIVSREMVMRFSGFVGLIAAELRLECPAPKMLNRYRENRRRRVRRHTAIGAQHSVAQDCATILVALNGSWSLYHRNAT